MNGEERPAPEDVGSPARPAPPWRDTSTLYTVALCLVIAATGWYLLQQLVSILRPLLLAVFLCYVLLPAHRRLTRRMPGVAALGVLAAVTAGVLYLLALVIYSSAVELSDDLPDLAAHARSIASGVEDYVGRELPWLSGAVGQAGPAEAQGTTWVQGAVNSVARAAAESLTEALVVGFYLFFLLLEVRRLPDRVRWAFGPEQGEEVLAVAQRINSSVMDYLKVKVRASLVLAVPAGLVLWAFGVRFPALWGVLTFLFNFLPYLGSIFGCGLPLLLTFLQPGLPLWVRVTVTVLLLLIHMASAYLVEPSMTGKAVGLSPLVILASLAFWGQCWGLTGMLLAVPLTGVLKIVLENIQFTRPFARLLSDR
jgi:AI-2 transport protein TqsA